MELKANNYFWQKICPLFFTLSDTCATVDKARNRQKKFRENLWKQQIENKNVYKLKSEEEKTSKEGDQN